VIATMAMTGISCSRRPESLIASASSRGRNLEIRLPEAPYAKLLPSETDSRRSLGSPDLAEAEAIVLRKNLPVQTRRFKRMGGRGSRTSRRHPADTRRLGKQAGMV
jgi:hypothetical protein